MKSKILKRHARGSSVAYASGQTYQGPKPDPRRPRLIYGDRDDFEMGKKICPSRNPVTSGVLNFEEGSYSDSKLRGIFRRHLRLLLPGIPEADYLALAYAHDERSKKPPNRLSIHYFVLNWHLPTGRKLQPYFYLDDARRVLAGQEYISLQEGQDSELNPEKARDANLQSRRLPSKARGLKKYASDLLWPKIICGLVDPTDREQLEEALVAIGFFEVRFKIGWTGRGYITALHPENFEEGERGTENAQSAKARGHAGADENKRRYVPLRFDGTLFNQWAPKAPRGSLAELGEEIRTHVYRFERDPDLDPTPLTKKWRVANPAPMTAMRAILRRENRPVAARNRRLTEIAWSRNWPEMARRDGFPVDEIFGRQANRPLEAAPLKPVSPHAAQPLFDPVTGAVADTAMLRIAEELSEGLKRVFLERIEPPSQ